MAESRTLHAVASKLLAEIEAHRPAVNESRRVRSVGVSATPIAKWVICPTCKLQAHESETDDNHEHHVSRVARLASIEP